MKPLTPKQIKRTVYRGTYTAYYHIQTYEEQPKDFSGGCSTKKEAHLQIIERVESLLKHLKIEHAKGSYEL